MRKLVFLFLLIANISTAQVNLNLGLKAYYPFNGNANDASGNNNNPSFNNATLTSDRLGNSNSAYHFNGTNNYMRIPNSPSVNFTNKMSIALWVKVTGFYQGKCHGNRIIMKGDGDFLTGSYLLTYDDNAYTNGQNCFITTPDELHQNFYGVHATTTTYVQKDQWYSLVYTSDGVTAKFYINCELKASEPIGTSTFTNNYDLFFGRLNDSQYPYWFNGDLDEVRIYDRALTVDEVNVLGGCSTTTTCTKTFQKLYGGNKDDFNRNIIENADGTYTSSGWTASFGNGGYDGYLQKADKNGNLIWSKTIGGAGDDLLQNLKATPDGGYVAVGSTKSFGSGSAEVAWMVKFNNNGDVQWARKFDDGNSNGSIAWKVTTTSDGGYAISGTNRYASGLANAMVIKTDNIGNVQWAKSFDSNNSDQGFGIIEDADSLVMTTNQYGQGSSLYNTVIMKIKSSNGNIGWVRNYDIDGRSNTPMDIFKTSTGYAFQVFNDVSFSLTNPDLVVVNTDNNGVPSSLRKTPGEPHGFTLTSDGGFIAAQRDASDPNSDIKLIKANNTGNVEWARNFGGTGEQRAYDIKQTSDGGYILAGMNNSTPAKVDSGQIYIIKTDNLGFTGSCNSSTITATLTTPTYTYNQSFIWSSITNLSFGTTAVTVTSASANPSAITRCASECITDTIINDYTPVQTFNSCANLLTVEDASHFNAGDTVLIIQMKGAVIDSTNTAAFGTITDYKNAGNYEFNYVKSKTGNVIELKNKLVRQYDIPNGRVQLVRVPYFTDYIVNTKLTCPSWDGSKGGILVLNVKNSLTLNNDIDVSNKGFRGGKSSNFTPATLACFRDNYFAPSTSTDYARKGEGIAEISNSKLNGRGNLANGGGGGNGHNAGGGGGSNVSLGGIGGYQLNSCGSSPYENRGKPGIALNGGSTTNRLYMGGGGGAGHSDHSDPDFTSKGGNGGGIAIIMSNTINNNNHFIIANGVNGENCTLGSNCHHDGMGGGGGGGTVVIKINNYSDTIKIAANGGQGDDLPVYSAAAGRVGPGGGGSGGCIYYSSAAAPAKSVTNVTGGKNGVIIPDANNPWGAEAGLTGVSFFNLTLPISTTPFKPNIDSVRFMQNAVSCTSFDFFGSAYTNTVGIAQWQWYFGDGGTANTQNASHTYLGPGLYSVKLIVTDINGCKDSIIKDLTVTASVLPTIVINGLATLCKGISATFTATSTYGGATPTYQWQKNGTNVGTNSTTYTDAGLKNGDIIKCVLTSSISCAVPTTVESNSITMTVSDPPSNIRYPTLTTLVYQPLQLQARTFSGAGYEWKPNIGLSNNLINNPIFSYGQQQEFKIYITTASGCIIVDTLLIKINGKKGIYVPKAFSPNGNGTNDRLYPILVGIKELYYFRIYNRWGNLLFQTNSGNPALGWDGTFRGALQPVETYTWTVEGIDVDGIIIKKSGNTLLIR